MAFAISLGTRGSNRIAASPATSGLQIDPLLHDAEQNLFFMQKLLFSESAIMATPASLKTFKVQLFKINDALNIAFDLAEKLETDIVEKSS